MHSRSGAKGINVGGSSILIIFVLLCLTTFATLSLVSANADYILAQKSADTTQEFYLADTMAEQKLSEIDACLAQAESAAADEEGYFLKSKELLDNINGISFEETDPSHLKIQFAIPSGKNAEICVTVEVQYPKASGQPRFMRKDWSLRNTLDWDNSGNTMNLWDGTID